MSPKKTPKKRFSATPGRLLRGRPPTGATPSRRTPGRTPRRSPRRSSVRTPVRAQKAAVNTQGEEGIRGTWSRFNNCSASSCPFSSLLTVSLMFHHSRLPLSSIELERTGPPSDMESSPQVLFHHANDEGGKAAGGASYGSNVLFVRQNVWRRYDDATSL